MTTPASWTLLGPGRASRYHKPEWEGRLVEEAGQVWLVPENWFCRHCDGCGCTGCKFTGLDSVVKTRKLARAARRRARRALRAGSGQGVPSPDSGGIPPGPPTGVGNPGT